jgi:hypothetical protein
MKMKELCLVPQRSGRGQRYLVPTYCKCSNGLQLPAHFPAGADHSGSSHAACHTAKVAGVWVPAFLLLISSASPLAALQRVHWPERLMLLGRRGRAPRHQAQSLHFCSFSCHLIVSGWVSCEGHANDRLRSPNTTAYSPVCK